MSADVARRPAGVDSRRQRRRGAGGRGADRAAAALNLRILLTSGTVTSAAIVAKRFPPDVIHQYVPYDSPRYVARFLDHWRPSLALFIEVDLWPNLILSSAARRLPMVLINGRMSHRSFPRWRRAPAPSRRCSAGSNVPGAVADRCRRFCGARQPQRRDHGQPEARRSGAAGRSAKLERLMAMTRGRPIVVAASTHPARTNWCEAHKTLAGFFPKLLTVIVPRHPDRGEAIARMVGAPGLQRRCARARNCRRQTDIYVADTMGELGLFYRLSPIVFMGGSLVEHGGQNPIEAVKLGASIVHGPHVFNFSDVYEALDAAGGARGPTARKRGQAARSVAGRSQGA
jgi:3-deoxy-D-manno-octulosonic-acid transferase